MRHVLIAVAVALVVLVEELWRAARSRRAIAMRPPPELVLEEHLSASGRFKGVVYPHYGNVLRVEVFQRIEREAAAPLWLRVSGPSFADRASLSMVVREALTAAGAEAVEADRP